MRWPAAPGDDSEAGGAGKDRFDQGQAADGGDRLDGGSGRTRSTTAGDTPSSP